MERPHVLQVYTSASRYGKVHLRTLTTISAYLCGFVNVGKPLCTIGLDFHGGGHEFESRRVHFSIHYR